MEFRYGTIRVTLFKLRKSWSMAQFYSAKRRVTTRQIITVKVNDLDPFGQGVARHNGKALFIPGLLPEESAEVIITEDKKQFSRATCFAPFK
ncbi:23S rRNA (uracil-5-)-methyltransferase RumA [Salmonella enterica subsp. arizonae]|uniref:23S rRNA (Uracil-5-)-methyltransferase RumA n=1 Tax=Salmonella enterica subsp. arizonae TaxID=59203 RepID=A0A2X4T2W4_SALER|nr:23S rRNA (uracil-5-)-methyltransferase RumA [Salmonella enterica subsp. arizonae]